MSTPRSNALPPVFAGFKRVGAEEAARAREAQFVRARAEAAERQARAQAAFEAERAELQRIASQQAGGPPLPDGGADAAAASANRGGGVKRPRARGPYRSSAAGAALTDAYRTHAAHMFQTAGGLIPRKGSAAAATVKATLESVANDEGAALDVRKRANVLLRAQLGRQTLRSWYDK